MENPIQLSTGAKAIKSEIDNLIGTWGIPAIMECIAHRLKQDEIDAMTEGEAEEAQKMYTCGQHANYIIENAG